MFSNFFNIDFWQQFTVTFVALVAGIPLALWLARRQEHAEGNEKRQTEASRRQQLLAALNKEVSSNRDALTAITTAIDAGRIESAPLWLSTLEATAALKYDLLEVPLCQALDELLYLLRAVDTFQNVQLQLLFNPSAHTAITRVGEAGATSFFATRHPRLCENLKDAATKAHAQAGKVLGMLPSEASQESMLRPPPTSA